MRSRASCKTRWHGLAWQRPAGKPSNVCNILGCKLCSLATWASHHTLQHQVPQGSCLCGGPSGIRELLWGAVGSRGTASSRGLPHGRAAARRSHPRQLLCIRRVLWAAAGPTTHAKGGARRAHSHECSGGSTANSAQPHGHPCTRRELLIPGCWRSSQGFACRCTCNWAAQQANRSGSPSCV